MHIGKCAGSSFREFLTGNFEANLNFYHLRRVDLRINNDTKNRFLFVVRRPIERFVSAFNHSKNLINFDISKITNPNELNLNNCLAPFHIKNKIKNKGIVFSKEYDDLIAFFQDANTLAESLSSNNQEKRSKAIKLMQYPYEHLYKGIGGYLHNGDFIRKYHSQIIFTGRLEYLKNDMEKFSSKNNIGLTFNSSRLQKIRSNSDCFSKFLSSKAIENIISWYQKTDFESIKVLCDYNFLPQSYYEECFKYNFSN